MKRSKNQKASHESLIDYSKKENQIGCGYCEKEKRCVKRDRTINKAKEGCEEWQHWQDSNLK